MRDIFSLERGGDIAWWKDLFFFLKKDGWKEDSTSFSAPRNVRTIYLDSEDLSKDYFARLRNYPADKKMNWPEKDEEFHVEYGTRGLEMQFVSSHNPRRFAFQVGIDFIESLFHCSLRPRLATFYKRQMFFHGSYALFIDREVVYMFCDNEKKKLLPLRRGELGSRAECILPDGEKDLREAVANLFQEWGWKKTEKLKKEIGEFYVQEYLSRKAA
ncbi:hypothetical protein A3B18_01270 [Candidatus Giovannonibacteria bacterium RIFCSPLOWO2_01_FULL_46_13]|uniref:Uncharacterized protein n=1 Tax=Candidatus Giovannonibacteria bacterium RIFCSPLOWO2_01_FULL_46_13 TaxID=1798352 RepID=A0A1F5X3X5_9BACT|nr:MAG: hypothetical protein A3B18_01270 [Candidatus Giovannonibacteria bacterium RIFCSPLOWO2_01_FULL_46_13]